MLTVACVRDRSGDYYLSELRQEPGVPRSWERGRWVGTGAQDLSSPPSPTGIREMLAGRHPASGRRVPLARTSSVVSYDLCWSAPKSVSALYALGDQAQRRVVVDAHREAVAGAFEYVSHHALTARRREEGDRFVMPVTAPPAAAFDHLTSRTLDPHLHSHVLVPNWGHGRDGRWSALDGRGLFRHAAAAGALYESELRLRLGRDLGVHWQRRRDGALEVGGVPSELLGAFSGRHAEIAQHLAESRWREGGASRGADRVAWAATRPEKAYGLDVSSIQQIWHRRADAVGVDVDLVRSLTHAAERVPGRHPVLDERHFARALNTRRSEEITRRTVVEAWADSAAVGVAATSAEEAVERWAPTTAVGVAEPPLAPARVVPAPAVLAEIGPRPADARHQDRWRETAARVERYRERWGGDGTKGLHPVAGAMPPAQLVEHLRVRRDVDALDRALGRAQDRPQDRRALSIGRS